MGAPHAWLMSEAISAPGAGSAQESCKIGQETKPAGMSKTRLAGFSGG
jgi:hypothetical protein